MRILCNECNKGFEDSTGEIVGSTIICKKCASKTKLKKRFKEVKQHKRLIVSDVKIK